MMRRTSFGKLTDVRLICIKGKLLQGMEIAVQTGSHFGARSIFTAAGASVQAAAIQAPVNKIFKPGDTKPAKVGHAL
jgi:hypothetical protein